MHPIVAAWEKEHIEGIALMKLVNDSIGKLQRVEQVCDPGSCLCHSTQCTRFYRRLETEKGTCYIAFCLSADLKLAGPLLGLSSTAARAMPCPFHRVPKDTVKDRFLCPSELGYVKLTECQVANDCTMEELKVLAHSANDKNNGSVKSREKKYGRNVYPPIMDAIDLRRLSRMPSGQ